MIRRIITVESLKGVMTQREYRDYCSGLSKEEVLEQIKSICVDKVYDGSYAFNIKVDGNVFMNGHPRKSMEFLCQNLLIRKLNQNILRAYRLKVVDRRKIINQIKQLLHTDLPMIIMRKDVHHFFESVNPNKILERLEEDGRIPQQSLALLHTLLGTTKDLGAECVPRGLAISSGLTEFYMRKFDYEFIRHEDVMLYSRFVDDMLFVCTSNVEVNEIQAMADGSFNRLGIEENLKKKQTVTKEEWESGVSFDFLGYQFSHEKKGVTINVASNKRNKIKTKIVLAFKQFIKDKDGKMLVERMRYLTCVSSIKSPSLRNVLIGTPANYYAVNGEESLKELDTFYRGLLSCKNGAFGTKLQVLFRSTPCLLERLRSINFVDSFNKKRRAQFSPTRMHQINSCWR